MGSMHTGLEEATNGFERMAAFYAERAARRRRPDRHRRLRAEPGRPRLSQCGSQLSFAWQVGKHRLITDAVHAEGGKIAMQILHTGRYGYHPLGRRAVAAAGADQPLHAARADALGHPQDHRRLRALRRDWRQTGRLRRRRGHGLRGLPDQPVPRAADQPAATDRWGGSFENRMRFAVEIVRARARGRRAGLHHHLPPVDARSGRGRQHLGRSRGAGQGHRGGRRDHHQHRHRLARGAHPDHRHHGAARRLRLGHRSA